MINFEEFSKVELKVGKIMSAEKVEGSEKLLRFIVSLGVENRQILAGIGKAYSPEELIEKEIVVVANLEPRMLMGFESQGMLLAATGEDGLPVLVCPDKVVEPGTSLK